MKEFDHFAYFSPKTPNPLPSSQGKFGFLLLIGPVVSNFNKLDQVANWVLVSTMFVSLSVVQTRKNQKLR